MPQPERNANGLVCVLRGNLRQPPPDHGDREIGVALMEVNQPEHRRYAVGSPVPVSIGCGGLLMTALTLLLMRELALLAIAAS